uniref:Uncharacterized protein n=1 Tax=Arundo donax TaxID=35708 RepID=A0A0A8ZJ62_ARUDO
MKHLNLIESQDLSFINFVDLLCGSSMLKTKMSKTELDTISLFCALYFYYKES